LIIKCHKANSLGKIYKIGRMRNEQRDRPAANWAGQAQLAAVSFYGKKILYHITKCCLFNWSISQSTTGSTKTDVGPKLFQLLQVSRSEPWSGFVCV